MNRHFMPRTLAALLTLAMTVGAPAAILAPDDLHFASRAPGEVVEASVWVINTDAEPLELLGAKASCGCTTVVGFAPQTLPAATAIEVPIRITAPKKAGQSKAVSVKFTVRDGATIMLPIRIETRGTASAPGGAITADPPALDLGRVTAATPAETTIRLTNTATAPVRVTGAKAGCGCISFPDFAPFELDADASADVRVSIKAPSVVGRSRTKDVTFKVDGGPPVTVPVRVQAVHPMAKALRQYFGLPETHESGRWCRDIRVVGDTVSAIVWAADAPRGRLVCRFDDDGRLRAIDIEPIATIGAPLRSARR
ncbi:MAG: DUF1573 domain-containing protein [Planctomycetota bacterium]|jgi:hypothetical protein